jgi:hypothetical protein
MREPHPFSRVRASSCAEGLRVLRQTIEGIEWLGGQRPALLDPDGKTVQWDQARSEILPQVITKYDMFCRNCHILELSYSGTVILRSRSRHDRRELVVERPSRKARFRSAGVSLPHPKSHSKRLNRRQVQPIHRARAGCPCHSGRDARAASGVLNLGHRRSKNFFYKALDKPIRRTID